MHVYQQREGLVQGQRDRRELEVVLVDHPRGQDLHQDCQLEEQLVLAQQLRAEQEGPRVLLDVVAGLWSGLPKTDWNDSEVPRHLIRYPQSGSDKSFEFLRYWGYLLPYQRELVETRDSLAVVDVVQVFQEEGRGFGRFAHQRVFVAHPEGVAAEVGHLVQALLF